jgi:hypothetical protein
VPRGWPISASLATSHCAWADQSNCHIQLERSWLPLLPWTATSCTDWVSKQPNQDLSNTDAADRAYHDRSHAFASPCHAAHYTSLTHTKTEDGRPAESETANTQRSSSSRDYRLRSECSEVHVCETVSSSRCCAENPYDAAKSFSGLDSEVVMMVRSAHWASWGRRRGARDLACGSRLGFGVVLSLGDHYWVTDQ